MVVLTPTSSTTSTTKASEKEEPTFLYYNTSKKQVKFSLRFLKLDPPNLQWVFGEELGSTSSLFFGTAEKSLAK